MDLILDYIPWIVLILLTVFIFSIKIITKNKNAITSKYIQNIEIDKEKITKEVIFSVMEKSKFKNIGYNEATQSFYGRTSFSMSSYFEIIEIEYKVFEYKDFLVFTSVCGLPTQIFDWGKNKRNFKKFKKFLNEKSNS